MKHVIIGAGAAGITAAKTIREIQSQDEIVVISTDDSVYSRCMLHKYISGERDEKSLSFITDNFFADNNIRRLEGCTVTRVDTGNKLVCFEGGSESYDKLLIATGSQSVIPPVGKLREANNVYGLRHLTDAKAIYERALHTDRIVVVGAGLVGLDAAYALVQMGKKPVIVEMADSILAINLDTHAAKTYQEKFEEAGCVFRLCRKVSDTVCDSSGAIISVVLDNGEELPCDMVIVAAGVRPATAFLENSDVACNRSVTVDQYLATNAEGIYAAGDVTGLSGIWPNAMKQGEVAARNMCGLPTVYDDRYALKNTVNFFGILSLSVGKLEPEDGDVLEIREDRDRYEKVILRGGIVVGVILQGNIGGSGFWQYLIKNQIDVSGIAKPVWKLSFADFYGVDAGGEYKWTIPA